MIQAPAPAVLLAQSIFPMPHSTHKKQAAVGHQRNANTPAGELAAPTTLSATTADGVDIKIPARFRLDLHKQQSPMRFPRTRSFTYPGHGDSLHCPTDTLPRFGERCCACAWANGRLPLLRAVDALTRPGPPAPRPPTSPQAENVTVNAGGAQEQQDPPEPSSSSSSNSSPASSSSEAGRKPMCQPRISQQPALAGSSLCKIRMDAASAPW